MDYTQFLLSKYLRCMQTPDCIFTWVFVKLLVQDRHFTILGIGDTFLNLGQVIWHKMQEDCVAFLMLHSKSPQMQLPKTVQYPSIASLFPMVRFQKQVTWVFSQFLRRLKSRHQLQLQSHLRLTVLSQAFLGCWHYSVSCSCKIAEIVKSCKIVKLRFCWGHSHHLETVLKSQLCGSVTVQQITS